MRLTPAQRIQKQLEHQRQLIKAAEQRLANAMKEAEAAPAEEKGRMGRLAGMRKAQLARITGKLQRLEREQTRLAAPAATAPRRPAGRRGRLPRSAVILAAGMGAKTWPYSETRQKAALPVANQPLIRRTLDDLRALGIGQVVVVVSHLQEQVRNALGDEVVYVQQPCACAGTANALLQAAEQVEGDDFLVLYGDTISARENYEALLNSFRTSGAEVSALVQPLPPHEPPENWLCAHAEGGRLRGIGGHSRAGQFRLTGAYAMRRSALSYVRRNPGVVRHVSVGGMPPLEAELAESIQIMLDEGAEVAAAATVDFLVDIDKPWHILDANRAVVDYIFRHTPRDQVARGAQVSPKASLSGRLIAEAGAVVGDGTFLEGNIYLARDSRVLRGAMLDNVMLGPHATARDFCHVGGAVVGEHGLIGHAAEFSGVMFDRVHLYHYCELAGIIGSATDVGAATVCGTLRFDDGEVEMDIKGRKERARHSGASYIGDYCRTGVNVMLMPGSRIGPYSCIGPGALIYRDVPSRSLVLVQQEQVVKEWGPEKYGW